jgi:hypothetical protein
MESLWGFVIIAGPLLLLIGLIAAKMAKSRNRVPLAETEAATKRVREEQAEDDAMREKH